MHIRPYNDRAIVLPEAIEGEKRGTPRTCLNGWFQMIIGSGNITSICCQVHPERYGGFDKCSFKKFWFSPQLMKMRLLGKYGYIQKMYKACQTCQHYEKNMKRIQNIVELEENEKAVTK